MKFGEQLKYYKIPEYNDNYLDYELLKRILKETLIDHITSIFLINFHSFFQIINKYSFSFK